MAYAIFALAAFVVQAAVVLIVFLAQMLWIFLQLLFTFLCWLLPILWDGCCRLGQSVSAAVQAGKRAKLMPLADAFAADLAHGLNNWTRSKLEAALINIVTAGGRGKPLNPPFDEILESIDAKTAADRLRVLLLAVARLHRNKTAEAGLVPLFLDIDEKCVEEGGRTRLQDTLLADYAAINRLKVKKTSPTGERR